jgi:hypothetical protein
MRTRRGWRITTSRFSSWADRFRIWNRGACSAAWWCALRRHRGVRGVERTGMPWRGSLTRVRDSRARPPRLRKPRHGTPARSTLAGTRACRSCEPAVAARTQRELRTSSLITHRSFGFAGLRGQTSSDLVSDPKPGMCTCGVGTRRPRTRKQMLCYALKCAAQAECATGAFGRSRVRSGGMLRRRPAVSG